MSATGRPATSGTPRILHRLAAIDGAVAGGAAALLVLAVTGAIMAPLHTMPVDAFGIDAAHTLLAVRLMSEGRALHADVATPLGDLAFRPFLWGAAVSDTSAGALALGRLINGAVVAILAALVCWRRLSVFSAVLVGAALTATALMPTQFGDPPWLSSSAMEYNKVGFSLAGLGFCLLVPRRRGAGGEVVDMALAAALVALCFHLKITYALGLAGALFVGGLLQKRIGFAFFVAALVAALSALSPTYLESINVSGLESYRGAYRASYPLYLALSNFELFAILVGAGVVFHAFVRRLAPLMTAVTIFAASFLIVTQNSQQFLIPSAFVAIVLLFEIMRNRLPAADRLAVASFGVLLVVYPSVLLGDWILGMWRYDSAQRSASGVVVERGAFTGFRVDRSMSVGEAEARDCSDSRSIRNQLLQERELEAIFARESLPRRSDKGVRPAVFIHVDHIDFTAVAGLTAWPADRILWRVTERDIAATPTEATAIFIPRFSKLREGFLARHGDSMAELGFRAGALGCIDYFVNDART